jgi:protein-S-isoprenylcysteine O-methyltransferase Ste14
MKKFVRLVILRSRTARAEKLGRTGTRLPARIWARSVLGVAAMSSLIFVAAGHLRYWQGWIYFSLNVALVALTVWVLRESPELMSERLKPGRGIKRWDKVYFVFSTPLYLLAVVLAGLDRGRFHWSRDFPIWVYALAILVYLSGQAVFIWAKKVNPFFSSVVRIQTDRGQTVCDRGPYRFVRHPGYLGGLVFGLATPFVLGSYWALIPQAVAEAMLVFRTLLEDEMLREELPGYREYARRIRHRLIPGVW